jgi:hypothetical protein
MAGDRDTAIKNLERAQGRQTGPVTPGGKDHARRNALRHGGYAESVVFPMCKEDDCRLHKMGECNHFRDEKCDKSQVCLWEVEHYRSRVQSLSGKDGRKAAREAVSTLATLQETIVLKANGEMMADGVMSEEPIVGKDGKAVTDKDGNVLTRKVLHAAADYTRRATKDTAEVLKDLTGYNEGQADAGAVDGTDIIRQLEESGDTEEVISDPEG